MSSNTHQGTSGRGGERRREQPTATLRAASPAPSHCEAAQVSIGTRRQKKRCVRHSCSVVEGSRSGRTCGHVGEQSPTRVAWGFTLLSVLRRNRDVGQCGMLHDAKPLESQECEVPMASCQCARVVSTTTKLMQVGKWFLQLCKIT